MKVMKLEDMFKGWFIGDFEPTAYKSKDFEVCYRVHPKGEKWEWHYHKEITEINLLVSGKMIMQGKELNVGDIFIVNPYEIADPDFLEDCGIVCVKTPSTPGDKYVVKEVK
jgi:mannose-6-phosphate isomerase-like protein (cupin superfamily)|tara:strand:+ start:5542 stop:5874 length:333 start_codon:yes stop_codon:yes gene_type:complete